MWKYLRFAILSTVLLVPFSGDRTSPVLAQEHQGCFLINFDGVLVDLSQICPAPTQLQVASPTGEPQLGTGDIQVTLRWTTLDDLDLAVTDPRGDVVAYYNRAVASGGQLDVDANAGCFSEQTSSPIENIFWPPSQAPQGNYTVTVNLFTRCGNSSGPIPFNLTLLVQGNTETLTGTVDDQNPIATFPFSLPR